MSALLIGLTPGLGCYDLLASRIASVPLRAQAFPLGAGAAFAAASGAGAAQSFAPAQMPNLQRPRLGLRMGTQSRPFAAAGSASAVQQKSLEASSAKPAAAAPSARPALAQRIQALTKSAAGDLAAVSKGSAESSHGAGRAGFARLLGVDLIGGQAVVSEEGGDESARFSSDLQREFEDFLTQGGTRRSEVPAPRIAEIAAELLSGIRKSRLGLNRYSFERNHMYGDVSIFEMVGWVADWGLDFMQIHISSFIGLSDDEIRATAEKARDQGLEIHLDVSSTREEDFREVFRIADVMGGVAPVRTIRTYIREFGTISRMTAAVVRHLRWAVREASGRGIRVFLEQHEVLTGREFRGVIEEVGGGLGALFDFANPVTAGERPEGVLRALGALVRMTHIKDALVLPARAGGWHQYGVKLGEGDLNVVEMLLQAIRRGAGLSLQSVVGYHAFSARDDATAADAEFSRRPPSETYVSKEIRRSPRMLRELLSREIEDAREQLDYIRWVRGRLEDFALRALGEEGLPDAAPAAPAMRTSPEIVLAREIEDLGRRLFPSAPKRVWPLGAELTPDIWRSIREGDADLDRGEAARLLAAADTLKRRLSPPLYDGAE